MKKLKLLSSTLVMTMVSFGAYAADGIITGGAGTCTVDVLKVSDNNATANTIATWSLNDYECGARQYLDEDTLTCTTCPAGSYCPGGTFTIENASSGTFDCPAGYTESAAGAGTNNECYTACTVANANIAHATAVTGNDYYGTTDADTCTPTNCELGYHVNGGEIEVYEKTPLIPVDYHEKHMGSACIEANGENSNSTTLTVAEAGLTEKNTWARQYDNGLVYGRASCQPQRTGEGGIVLAGVLLSVALGGTTMDEAYVVMKDAYGTLKADSWKYMMEQQMAGNITDSEFQNWMTAVFFVNNDAEYNTTDIGTQCWCQITDFMPTNGDKTAIVSAPWVYDGNFQSESSCADSCAYTCSTNDKIQAAMFGAIDYRIGGGMCKVTETDCPAGQYLAIVGDAMMCVPCKSGSYCPGGVYTIESENKGTNACPAGYAQSDEGASANTQCYTACTLETANIAHATAVGGNDYFGSGVDACYATACDTGYHVNNDIELVEQTPVIPVDYETAGNGNYAYIDPDGSTENNGIELSELSGSGTYAVDYDYGRVYGRASCQPKADAGNEYIYSNLDGILGGTIPMETVRSELTSLVGAGKAEAYMGMLSVVLAGGEGMSEEEQLAAVKKYYAIGMLTDANYSTDSTGRYCYCQLDGFSVMTDGVLGEKISVTSAPWVFNVDGSLGDCASTCASNCAGYLQFDGEFRAAVFGSLGTLSTGICAANTINIDWNPDNGGAHTQNMCYYDGEITLPDEPVKVGYTFSGWKLVEPNSTPVQ